MHFPYVPVLPLKCPNACWATKLIIIIIIIELYIIIVIIGDSSSSSSSNTKVICALLRVTLGIYEYAASRTMFREQGIEKDVKELARLNGNFLGATWLNRKSFQLV